MTMNEDQGQNVELMRGLDAALMRMKEGIKQEHAANERLRAKLKDAVATIYREDGTKEVVPATIELLERFNHIVETTDKILSVRFNASQERSNQRVNHPGKAILRQFVKEQAPHLRTPVSPYGDILVLYQPYPGAGEE